MNGTGDSMILTLRGVAFASGTVQIVGELVALLPLTVLSFEVPAKWTIGGIFDGFAKTKAGWRVGVVKLGGGVKLIVLSTGGVGSGVGLMDIILT